MIVANIFGIIFCILCVAAIGKGLEAFAEYLDFSYPAKMNAQYKKKIGLKVYKNPRLTMNLPERNLKVLVKKAKQWANSEILIIKQMDNNKSKHILTEDMLSKLHYDAMIWYIKQHIHEYI